MKKTLFVLSLLVVMAFPALGASSFLGGLSGNIITPDGVIVPDKTWEISYHNFTDLLDGNDLSATGVSYGLLNNLEVGASLVNDNESQIAFNGKYRLVTETANAPTVAVGVFDVAGTADDINNDPGFFLLVSKNITPFASEVANEPSKPLRLTLGFGSGVFDGFFAGLDWTLEPRLSVMAEFFGGDLGDNNNLFNAGLRYAVSDNFRVDVATIDFDNIAFGANVRFGY